LLGKTHAGRFAFLTVDTIDVVGTKASRRVVSYDASDLKTFAAIARKSIPKLERALKLREHRKRYLRQSLLPDTRSQQTQKPSAGGKPQKKGQQKKGQPKKGRKPSARQRRDARMAAAKAAAARRSRGQQ
jgi:hypothetical protein